MPQETLSMKLQFDGQSAITGMNAAAQSFTRMHAGAKQAQAGIANLRQGFAGMRIAAGALTGAAVLSVKTFAGFDDAMGAVKAVLGKDAAPAFAGLTAKAKELGATTAFTATEAAAAMENLARSGMKPAQIISAIGPTLAAASAEGMGLATSADIVASNMKAFGLQASDATRIADALAFVSAKTNTNMVGLQEGLKFVGPVAKSMGIQLEDTAAALGVLADVGLKGSLAGTGLKNALLKIAQGAKGGKIGVGKFNAEIVQTADGGVDLARTMLNITTQLQRIDNPMARAKASMKLLGLRGMGAAAAFDALGKDGAKVDLLFKDMRKSAKGTAGEMSKMRLDTLGGDFKLFSSAVSAAATSFGQILRDFIRPFVREGGGVSKVIGDAAKAVTMFWGSGSAANTAFLESGLVIAGMSKGAVQFAKGFVEGIRSAANIFKFFGSVLAVPFNFLKGLFSSPTSIMGDRSPGISGATKMAIQIGAIAIGLKASIGLFGRFGRVAVGTFQLIKGSLGAAKGAIGGTVKLLASKLPTLARVLPRGLGKLAGAVNAADKISAQSVRVVNFDEMGGMGGPLGRPAGAPPTNIPGSPAAPMTRMGRAASAASTGVALLGSAIAGWQIGKAIDQAFNLSKAFAKMAFEGSKTEKSLQIQHRAKLDTTSAGVALSQGQGSAAAFAKQLEGFVRAGKSSIKVSDSKGHYKKVALTRAVAEAQVRRQFKGTMNKEQLDIVMRTIAPTLERIDALTKAQAARPVMVRVDLNGRKVNQETGVSEEEKKTRTTGPGKPGGRRSTRK